MPFKVVELFAGAGGMALGFEQSGLQAELLVEINKDAAATLLANRPDWNVIHGDVSEVDFTKYEADIVSGGFPCQAFSYAGKGLGFEDTRGTLFFEFARAVKEIQPKIFVGENVEGLKNHDGGRTLDTMVTVLTELGYHVQMKVLNAADFSVAQKRKRLILIGTKPGYNFTYPEKRKEKITLRDALKEVPTSPGTKFSEKRYNVLKLVPPGGCWVDLPVEIQKEFMGASFTSGGGKRGMARRISWDEQCLTLTTSPSQKQTERCHPDETRPFTVREYARIQSFPDTWEFSGSISSMYKQIGNAVAVNVAEAIGTSIIHSLNNPNGKKTIHTKFTVLPKKVNEQSALTQFGIVNTKLNRAIKNSELHELKDEITDKVIQAKLKNPVNTNSPIASMFDSVDEFVKEKAKGWVKSASGVYLAKVVCIVSNIPGWEFDGGKYGKKNSVKNEALGKCVVMKTQGSTANDSAKIGDKVKEAGMVEDGLTVHSLNFFVDACLDDIHLHFGLVKEDVEAVKNFLRLQYQKAVDQYTHKMKRNPAFQQVENDISPYLA